MPEVSKTADQALVILETISRRGPLSIAEAARELELSRTVVYRLLTTLEYHGMVRRTSGIYRLGPALFGLAQQVEQAVREAARLPMTTLSETLKETVVLTVRDGLDAVSADRIVGRSHILQVAYPPGLRHPLTQTASGRVILAYATPEDRESAAKAAGLALPTLETGLSKIRKKGYATSSSEYQDGLSGTAVPIRSSDGVIASLAVVTPVNRAEIIESNKQLIIAAADQVSLELLDS